MRGERGEDGEDVEGVEKKDRGKGVGERYIKPKAGSEGIFDQLMKNVFLNDNMHYLYLFLIWSQLHEIFVC